MSQQSHPMDATLKVLQSETPRISVACKNLVAVVAGQDLVPAAADGESNKKPADKKPHEMQHLLEVAKTILKCVNAYDLPTEQAWQEKHPQGEDESGSERIEAVTAYKACFTASAAVRRVQARPAVTTYSPAAANAKITKLFGRGYLRATKCWEDGVGEACAQELARLRFPPHTCKAMLATFEKAIHDTAEDGDAALIWAADFHAALHARRLAREAEVRERRQRMETGETEAQALRAALAGQEEEEEEARVVEVM